MELSDNFPHDFARELYPPALGYRVDVCPEGWTTSLLIRRNGNRVARMRLTFVPGNSSLLILHGMRVYKNFRGTGHGRKLHHLALRWASAVRAVRVACTVLESNRVQQHLLQQVGWKKAFVFVNPRNLREFAEWQRWFNIVTTSNRPT